MLFWIFLYIFFAARKRVQCVMPEFLQNKYFYYFTIPVMTILLTTFVKVVSRNDRFSLDMRADLAFGLDLSISAILLLTSHTLTYIAANANKSSAELTDCINKISTIPLIMLGLLFFCGFNPIRPNMQKAG